LVFVISQIFCSVRIRCSFVPDNVFVPLLQVLLLTVAHVGQPFVHLDTPVRLHAVHGHDAVGGEWLVVLGHFISAERVQVEDVRGRVELCDVYICVSAFFELFIRIFFEFLESETDFENCLSCRTLIFFLIKNLREVFHLNFFMWTTCECAFKTYSIWFVYFGFNFAL